ncbi:MAG: penicillin-binding protein 2 [Chitinophagales bacterium]|nr:penicillin-binding protein 2 [Chitinophagales bacterium]
MSLFKEGNSSLLRPAIYIIAVVYLIRLFILQVTSPSYKDQATSNVIKKQTIYPSRGLILDRNNKVLVYNEAFYDIYVQTNRIKPDIDSLKLCTLLNITLEEYQKKMKEIKKSTPLKPTIFLKQLTPVDFARFQEHLYQFSGFSYKRAEMRRFPFHSGGMLYGYLAEVDQQKIDDSKGYYELGDYAGKTGLEAYYEEELRGVKGVSFQLVDNLNRPKGSYKEGKEDVLPVAGKDMSIGIDAALQKYGEDLMQNKCGSVVAIDPKTGEILAYISAPTFDPNVLSGRYFRHNYKVLNADKYKPLFNRPVMATYPPGSTFKLAGSLIAFETGTRPPEKGYSCGGGFRLGGHTINCHRHPYLTDGMQAISYSCNAYYCQIFKDMISNDSIYGSVENAYRAWYDYMYSFGFGHKLGIDMKSENKGILPSADFYNKRYGKKNWKATTVISIAIGQGEVTATPLQMANEVAMIANRGYYYVPHLVRGFVTNDTLYKLKYEKTVVDVDKKWFEPVIDGMELVVKKGTAARVNMEELRMCGKTGTAQNPHGKDHSMFVAFAPKENPKIAIAVIVENAGFGATYAAPIASLMIEKYMNDTIAKKRKPLEKRMLDAKLIYKEEPKPKNDSLPPKKDTLPKLVAIKPKQD